MLVPRGPENATFIVGYNGSSRVLATATPMDPKACLIPLLGWWGHGPVEASGAFQIPATLCRAAMAVSEGQCDKVCVCVLNVLLGIAPSIYARWWGCLHVCRPGPVTNRRSGCHPRPVTPRSRPPSSGGARCGTGRRCVYAIGSCRVAELAIGSCRATSSSNNRDVR